MFTVPLVHSPCAENMFRRWLVNLPSEKLCWMARSLFMPSTRSLPVLLCKNPGGMEGSQCISPVFSYVLYEKRLNYALCIPTRLVKSHLVLAYSGILLKKGERGKKKKSPVSKQDRACFCTKPQYIVWQCFTNLLHLSLIWRHLLFPQQRMSDPAPFLDLQHFWVSYAAQRISAIFPLSVITAQCISTSLWHSLISSASLRLQECLTRAFN